jgi:hypothetical protein
VQQGVGRGSRAWQRCGGHSRWTAANPTKLPLQGWFPVPVAQGGPSSMDQLRQRAVKVAARLLARSVGMGTPARGHVGTQSEQVARGSTFTFLHAMHAASATLQHHMPVV